MLDIYTRSLKKKIKIIENIFKHSHFQILRPYFSCAWSSMLQLLHGSYPPVFKASEISVVLESGMSEWELASLVRRGQTPPNSFKYVACLS